MFPIPHLITSPFDELEGKDAINVHTCISVFDKVSPATVTEKSQKDPIVSLVYKYVAIGAKPKPTAIANIASKSVRRYLLRFDHLTFKSGVLHWLYTTKNALYHQLVLPQIYLPHCSPSKVP